MQASSRSPVTQQVRVEVEFDSDQVVQTSTRMVDGEVTVLAPFELEQIQRRALDLLERWRPDPRRTP